VVAGGLLLSFVSPAWPTAPIWLFDTQLDTKDLSGVQWKAVDCQSEMASFVGLASTGAAAAVSVLQPRCAQGETRDGQRPATEPNPAPQALFWRARRPGEQPLLG
jgi:hypothetical protein